MFKFKKQSRKLLVEKEVAREHHEWRQRRRDEELKRQKEIEDFGLDELNNEDPHDRL